MKVTENRLFSRAMMIAASLPPANEEFSDAERRKLRNERKRARRDRARGVKLFPEGWTIESRPFVAPGDA